MLSLRSCEEANAGYAFEFRKNSIVVTIPFNRFVPGTNDLVDNNTEIGNVQVNDDNAQVFANDTSENAQVANKNAQVNVQVEGAIDSKILRICENPRSLLEIAEYLGVKDRRTVRKYLRPLLEQGRIAMTIPDKPNSRFQKYIAIK